MVTHTCKLVVICNQDRYQRFVGSRQHQRQVPRLSYKLQVISGIYSMCPIYPSSHSSYKSQVTRTKKSKVSPLCFCCCLARNISEPPRNYAEDLFIIFFCCYVAFPQIPEFVHLYIAYRLCRDLQLCPTYYLGINISSGEDISAPLYTPTCLVVRP